MLKRMFHVPAVVWRSAPLVSAALAAAMVYKVAGEVMRGTMRLTLHPDSCGYSAVLSSTTDEDFELQLHLHVGGHDDGGDDGDETEVPEIEGEEAELDDGEDGVDDAEGDYPVIPVTERIPDKTPRSPVPNPVPAWSAPRGEA